MGNILNIQNAFTSGEISPLLHGRPELDLYRSGVSILENFIILPHGGITRRPGTIYSAEVKDSSKKVRLQGFQFSTTVAYMLEFGDQYMRVYKDGSQVMSGGSPYEIATPYTLSDLPGLSFAGSGDYVFIAHENHHPRELTRTSDTNWTLNKSVIFDGPYDVTGLNENNNLGPFAEATLTPGAVSGNGVSLTASGTGLTTFFSADDVDRLVRLYDTTNNQWGAAKIVAYTDPLNVTIDIFADRPFGSTTGTTIWRLGSWSDFHGWPSKVSFHEERLVHANTLTYVNRVWGSRPNDFRNLSPSDPDGQVDDSHSYAYSLATGSFDEITWLKSDATLLCGTSSGPFSLGGSDLNTPITPLSVRAKQEVNIGSSDVEPASIGKVTVYVRKGKTGAQALRYSFQDGGFISQDLTNTSEHLFRGKLLEIDDAILPYYNVFGHGESDRVFSLTMFQEQQVLAWAHFLLGGTDVVVESLAVIPDSTDTYSQLWLAVKRTINGATKRYIEYVGKIFDINNDPQKEDAYFVDCGITYDGSATSTITGLDHLEGETVKILADGAVHPDRTVSNGQVTLNDTYSKVHVGLSAPAYLKSLPVEFITDQGSTQHRIKRIDHIYANIHNSLSGIQFGPDLTKLELIALRNTEDEMDSSIDLFTGTVDLPFDGAYSRDNSFVVYQENPVPLTIRSIGVELEIYGR